MRRWLFLIYLIWVAQHGCRDERSGRISRRANEGDATTWAKYRWQTETVVSNTMAKAAEGHYPKRANEEILRDATRERTMHVSHTDKIPKSPRGRRPGASRKRVQTQGAVESRVVAHTARRGGVARGTRGAKFSKYLQEKAQPSWQERRAAYEKRTTYVQTVGFYPERVTKREQQNG